jgi:hypothetical protein
MVYNKKTLAKIGRAVLDQHPDIASGIIRSMAIPACADLSMVPTYFALYCQAVQIDPDILKGPVYKSDITEIKKVFISAMINLYSSPHLFNKVISSVLTQNHRTTSWMINEVKVRYQKDIDFTNKVNNTLKTITDDKGRSEAVN